MIEGGIVVYKVENDIINQSCTVIMSACFLTQIQCSRNNFLSVRRQSVMIHSHFQKVENEMAVFLKGFSVVMKKESLVQTPQCAFLSSVLGPANTVRQSFSLHTCTLPQTVNYPEFLKRKEEDMEGY